MAGRLRGLREQLERMTQQAEALYDELAKVQARYARIRGGLWREHAEAAGQGLMDACDRLGILVTMVGDLVGGRGDGTGADEAVETQQGQPEPDS